MGTGRTKRAKGGRAKAYAKKKGFKKSRATKHVYYEVWPLRWGGIIRHYYPAPSTAAARPASRYPPQLFPI